MSRALGQEVGEVDLLGPVALPGLPLRERVVAAVAHRLLGRRYDHDHSTSRSRAYARVFAQRLEAAEYDVVFAPAASTEIAYLETGLPVVYLSDSTFARMLDYHPQLTALWRGSAAQGHDIERRAISGADLCFFSSEWAAGSAVRDYGADPAKVHIVPLGANIDHAPPEARVGERRLGPTCRIVLVGVDWYGKGADIALEATEALNAMGIDAVLTVCGCTPPAGVRHPRLRVVPFLDKNDPAQFRKFEDALWDADFMVMPTRWECFGIVFAEASAYGLPSFASDTGGVAGAVHEGVNGHLLPPGASGEEYAARIAAVFRDRERYRALSSSSRALFDRALNWSAWARRVGALMETVL